jgi:exopolysaccharide production protein ExoZ
MNASARYYGIQILRGVAAVLVLFHHQVVALRDLRIPGAEHFFFLLRGAFGVDIFFPVSGFVMFLTASAALRRTDSVNAAAEFTWRRLIRILPLYWIFTTLKLAADRFTVSGSLVAHFGLWYIAASYLFLPAYNPHGQVLPILPVGWTLAYEAMFYLVVALCIRWRAPLLTWCALAIGVSSLIGIYIPHAWGALTWMANPIELEFLGGLFLAALCQRKILLPSPLAVLIIISCVLWIASIPWEAEESLLRAALWGIPGCLLLWSFTSLERGLNLSKRRLLLLLGDASYSLYLVHLFIVPLTARLVARLHPGGLISLTLAQLAGAMGTIGVAILVHTRIELPLMSFFLGRVPWSLRVAEERS